MGIDLSPITIVPDRARRDPASRRDEARKERRKCETGEHVFLQYYDHAATRVFKPRGMHMVRTTEGRTRMLANRCISVTLGVRMRCRSALYRRRDE